MFLHWFRGLRVIGITQIGSGKTFLFLQGPHGPYFDQLSKMLVNSGARALRVGFNRGDQAFWENKDTFIPFTKSQDEWPTFIAELFKAEKVTDIVLYGDVRYIHAEAVRVAKDMGIQVHVFEEGYLRPYWVTYERGGSNGYSRLMDKTVPEMRQELSGLDLELPDVPTRWGDMRQHIFYGAAYHFWVMFLNKSFTAFKPHRELSVKEEFRLYLKRLVGIPARIATRRRATRRIKKGGYPFHLAILQLAHDSSFIAHSPFETMTQFIEVTIAGFAAGAPRHHHLVFKGHPLEDGRLPMKAEIARIAARNHVADRVHYVPGGKLAELLNLARTAITVNSTAGQQALWRGLPIKVFGSAVYAKPEFVSKQPLAAFFADPKRPDSRAYRDFRHYLLETSQVTGGFYSRKGREQLMRQVVDLMLAKEDPYKALRLGNAAPRQQLTLVK